MVDNEHKSCGYPSFEVLGFGCGIQDVWRKLTRVSIIIHVNPDGSFGNWVRRGDALVVFSGAKDAGYNVIQVPLLQWYGRDGVLRTTT